MPSEHFNGKALVSQAERAAVVSTIWDQRRQGRTVFDIAQSLGMPTNAVRKAIEESFAEWRDNMQGKVEEEMTLDIARLNLVIQQNLPVAQSINVYVARQDSKGRVYTDKEYQYALDAGKLVIDAIKQKSNILKYNDSKGDTYNQHNNFMIWQNAPPNLEKIANAKEVSNGSSSDPLDLSFSP